MNSSTEMLEKYIVIEHHNDNTIKIMHRDDFKSINVCETHSKFGAVVGCTDAGCYSFDNSESVIFEHCIDEIETIIVGIKDKVDEIESVSDFINGMIAIDMNDDEQTNEMCDAFDITLSELKKAYDIVQKFKKQEDHETVDAFTFWNGSNWISIVLGDENADYKELSEEKQLKILSEFKGNAQVVKGAYATYETENYEFTSTLYQSDPFICTVEEK